MVAPASPAATPPAGNVGTREVRWWVNSGKLDDNIELIKAHRNAVTGIYTYIGAGVGSDGAFSCAHNASWFEAHLAPYRALGLTVTPALALADGALTSGDGARRVRVYKRSPLLL